MGATGNTQRGRRDNRTGHKGGTSGRAVRRGERTCPVLGRERVPQAGTRVQQLLQLQWRQRLRVPGRHHPLQRQGQGQVKAHGCPRAARWAASLPPLLAAHRLALQRRGGRVPGLPWGGQQG